MPKSPYSMNDYRAAMAEARRLWGDDNVSVLDYGHGGAARLSERLGIYIAQAQLSDNEPPGWCHTPEELRELDVEFRAGRLKLPEALP